MSPPRLSPLGLLRFYGLLALVLGGHAVSLLADRESWPYSPYEMFSSTPQSKRTLSKLVLVGETKDGRDQWLDNRSLAPLRASNVRRLFGRSLWRGVGPEGLEDQLHETLDYYDRLRLRDPSGRPPLRALRLYRATWKLDVGLTNVRSPDKTLIASYPPEATPR